VYVTPLPFIYWTSTFAGGVNATQADLAGGYQMRNWIPRGRGSSVRCIKD
jgi:hypothetical protein